MEQIDKLIETLKIMNEQIKTVADICLDNQKVITTIAETQHSIAKLLIARNN